MSYTYDPKNNTLFHRKTELPLDGLEQNFVGTCSECNADVMSVSYHTFEDQTAVAAKCTSCEKMYAIIYDKLWNWIGEHPVALNSSDGYTNQCESSTEASSEVQNDATEELKTLQSIPKKKLEVVFTPAEIDTMFAKAAGEKHVRQYLYRARKKYEDFQELFDVYLNV